MLRYRYHVSVKNEGHAKRTLLQISAELHGLFQIVLGEVFRIRIHLIRILIQHFRLNIDPDPIRTKGFDDQELEKIYCLLKFFKNIFGG